MSVGLDPEIQALAETIGKMRAALIRCGVNGPFVMHIPATTEGFQLSNRLAAQVSHPVNEHHHRTVAQMGDRKLIGVLAGMELRFYDPTSKR